MKYKTIIFDLDGTLVDSKINFAAIYKSLNLDSSESIIQYVDSLNETDRKVALDIVHHYEDEGANNSKLIPGVLELIADLSSRNINTAVFTLNSQRTARKTLDLHKLNIPLLVARENAKPKPDPEGLLKICNHYGTSVDQALYIGDYKYDLIAGQNAQIKTALFSVVEPDFDTDSAYFQFSDFSQLSEYIFK